MPVSKPHPPQGVASTGSEHGSIVQKDSSHSGLFRLSWPLLLAPILAGVVFNLKSYVFQDNPPRSYALCTPDGKNVYTVDASNTRTQCILVHKALIVDTGSLGQCPYCQPVPRSLFNMASPEQMQSHWENSVVLHGVYNHKPLPVRWTKPGSIVVPGLAGQSGNIHDGNDVF